MTEILLINPPIRDEDVYSKFAEVAPKLPPLGLCYLGAFLERAGTAVRIIDCPAQRVSLFELKNLVAGIAPRIVGVTSTSVSFKSAMDVFSMLKNLNPKILTILGGAHVSATRDAALKECAAIDIGVTGEGESTLLEICNLFERGAAINEVPGTIVRAGAEIRINRPRALEPNIDSFPYPARNLLGNLSAYAHSPFRGAGFTVSMISSRGCPFSCSYCDQSIFGKTWRAHSPQRVVEEMEHVVATYGADFISFEDDNFLLNRARVVEICRLLITKKLPVRWGCSLRVDSLDEEALSLMKSAGCRIVYLGIESASPRILKLLDRHLSIHQIRTAVKTVKSVGLKAYGAFILGLPTETYGEILQTIDFSLRLPLDAASYFLFTPYPNIKLRHLAETSGNVSKDWRDYSAHPSRLPFIPNGISESQLLKLQASAYRRFFFRWRYLRTHSSLILTKSFLRRSLPMLRKLLKSA